MASLTVDYNLAAQDPNEPWVRKALPDPDWRLPGETDLAFATRVGGTFGFLDGWDVNTDGQGNLLLYTFPPDPPPPAPNVVQIGAAMAFPIGKVPPGWTLIVTPSAPLAGYIWAHFTG